jgi:hypothetical protein
MRLITGADIASFYNGRDDLLVLDSGGTYMTVDYSDIADGDTTAYSYAIANDGSAFHVLLERTTIDEGEWFPDALDENGNLDSGVADEMAEIINNDANLHTALAVHEFRAATLAWREAEDEAARRALARARAVLKVVDRCSGNQSLAARGLGLDQSTVNKLVRKARSAEVAGS